MIGKLVTLSLFTTEDDSCISLSVLIAILHCFEDDSIPRIFIIILLSVFHSQIDVQIVFQFYYLYPYSQLILATLLM